MCCIKKQKHFFQLHRFLNSLCCPENWLREFTRPASDCQITLPPIFTVFIIWLKQDRGHIKTFSINSWNPVTFEMMRKSWYLNPPVYFCFSNMVMLSYPRRARKEAQLMDAGPQPIRAMGAWYDFGISLAGGSSGFLIWGMPILLNTCKETHGMLDFRLNLKKKAGEGNSSSGNVVCL